MGEQARDGLRQRIAEEPANRYTGLVSSHGRARPEVGLIPESTFRRLIGPAPRTALVTRDGWRYIRPWYAIDDCGTELGFVDAEDFRAAICRSIADRKRVDQLTAKIQETCWELRTVKSRRANPVSPPAIGGFRRFLARLRGEVG